MFSGAITAMITPFRDGKLDEARLREQVEFQIAGGIDALIPVGTTGECPTLDFDEHKRVIEITVEVAAGRVPIIAGTGSNNTAEALMLQRFAKSAGASAGLSVNPYYNKPSQEGMYHHFMTIADQVDLPIVLYNIPGRTGVTLQPQTIARLARHPHIVAVKEATGVVDTTSEILQLCDLTVLSGDDSLTLALMAVGAKGVVSVLSNLVPGQIKTMTKLATAGNFAKAREIHQRLFPLMRAMFADGNPVGIKFALQQAGRDTGELRPPLWEASESTKRQISELMATVM